MLQRRDLGGGLALEAFMVHRFSSRRDHPAGRAAGLGQPHGRGDARAQELARADAFPARGRGGAHCKRRRNSPRVRHLSSQRPSECWPVSRQPRTLPRGRHAEQPESFGWAFVRRLLGSPCAVCSRAGAGIIQMCGSLSTSFPIMTFTLNLLRAGLMWLWYRVLRLGLEL